MVARFSIWQSFAARPLDNAIVDLVETRKLKVRNLAAGPPALCSQERVDNFSRRARWALGRQKKGQQADSPASSQGVDIQTNDICRAVSWFDCVG